jgi:hypothetical protein
MAGQIAPRVIEGRAFNGGVAMAVTRAPGQVRIVLTVMPGHPAASPPEGETAVIAFPQPVPVTAGDRVAIVIEWAGGDVRDYAGPVWMPVATVLAAAHIRR